MSMTLYKSGHWVPTSGIYDVFENGRWGPRQITCVEGERFPSSPEGGNVFYQLAQKKVHKNEDSQL